MMKAATPEMPAWLVALQVAAFQMLTGWPQEDLVDPLGGAPLAGAALFDRLEEVVGGPLRPVQVQSRQPKYLKDLQLTQHEHIGNKEIAYSS